MARKTIFLLVFNRPEKTRRCLEAMRMAKGIEGFHLLVVRQEGNEEVARLIEEIDWIEKTHEVVEVKAGWEGKAERAVNHNIRYGLEWAFDRLRSEWVAVVEDDILIGYDFLEFCGEMIARHGEDPEFMAVNGFSRKPRDEDRLFDYGKFRFGVGWGWAIPRRSWEGGLCKGWIGEEEAGSWDVHIEPLLRRGYVVMPHCSRSYNIGWGAGAVHMSDEADARFFEGMRRSWVGTDAFPTGGYVFNPKLRRVWRMDCARVGRFDDLVFLTYRAIVAVRHHPGLRALARRVPLKQVRRLFDLPGQG